MRTYETVIVIDSFLKNEEIDEIVNMVLAKLKEGNSLPDTEDSNMVKKKKKDSTEESKDVVMADDKDDKLDKPTGGRKKSDKAFDEEALEKGTKVEGEHTTKKDEAEKIAKDHLVEDDKYYDKLAKIEKSEDSTFNDDAEKAIATKDVEEAKEVKEKPKKKEDKKELPQMKEMADDSEFKILGRVNEKPVIETVDTAFKIADRKKEEIVETADNSIYEQKYRTMLIKELADRYVALGKSTDTKGAESMLTEKSTQELEIYQDAFDGLSVQAPEPKVTQKSKSIIPKYKDIVTPSGDDSSSDIVPQHGGTVGGSKSVYAFQDMSPKDRVAKFGEYGSFDLCFHPQNVSKYSKHRSK